MNTILLLIRHKFIQADERWKDSEYTAKLAFKSFHIFISYTILAIFMKVITDCSITNSALIPIFFWISVCGAILYFLLFSWMELSGMGFILSGNNSSKEADEHE